MSSSHDSDARVHQTSSINTDIILLDGGFGTTLEQTFHEKVSHKPLWSTKAIIDNPEVVVQTHLSFLRTNARFISTATYQSSYREFDRAGILHKDTAKAITRKAVELADRARLMYRTEIMLEGDVGNKSGSEDIRIVLALGPFGASLSPTQEWDALYPPPYGPVAYGDCKEAHRNWFRDDEEEASNESIKALAEFHRDRLLMFLEDEAGRKVWEKVDWVAFETIPLIREVKAIRIAVAQAFSGRKDLLKPWWISAIFPDGEFPEGKTEEGRHATRDVVHAMLGDLLDEDGQSLPTPRGIGVNCTSVNNVLQILGDFENVLRQNGKRSISQPSRKHWLVVYPNAGDIFDEASQSWVEEDEPSRNQRIDIWAQTLTRSAVKSAATGLWETILVGGCCRTNSAHMRCLYDHLYSVC
ncbi:AdoMet-homocysteine methyltransferase [Marasmius tenuissimus]|nr:AdoMet-homocysteine methyltransferase [Marasmius tenuissimus]